MDKNKLPGADDNIQRNRIHKSNKICTIQDMFNSYLSLVKLPTESELIRISPFQHKEIKRAFYGAISQLLVVQRDQITEVESDELAAVELEKIWQECNEFWRIQK